MLSMNSSPEVRSRAGAAGPESQSCSYTRTPDLRRYRIQAAQSAGSVDTLPDIACVFR